MHQEGQERAKELYFSNVKYLGKNETKRREKHIRMMLNFLFVGYAAQQPRFSGQFTIKSIIYKNQDLKLIVLNCHIKPE